jgi:hypothetical protein
MKFVFATSAMTSGSCRSQTLSIHCYQWFVCAAKNLHISDRFWFLKCKVVPFSNLSIKMVVLCYSVVCVAMFLFYYFRLICSHFRAILELPPQPAPRVPTRPRATTVAAMGLETTDARHHGLDAGRGTTLCSPLHQARMLSSNKQFI